MATERIVIENYKGIKKLDLEVRPFTVLIGPQDWFD
jgi:predicted ATPase